MSKIFYILLIGILFSCEKVIDLDLNDDDPKIIIEGIINKDSTENFVRITKSINFDEKNNFPSVDNASVKIYDSEGNSQNLAYVSKGFYKTTDFLGVEGRTYFLEVVIEGKKYQSSSTMPTQVMIDTITLQEFAFGPTPTFYPIANRFDPPGIRNYYNFNLYKNNKRVNGIYIQDDQFSDGVEILQPIFGGDYLKNDTMRLEMFCIDVNVHKYFYTLGINGGGTEGATPANPESNITGGCLGYFSAQTKQIKTLVIP
jgi:hypothetical protein